MSEPVPKWLLIVPGKLTDSMSQRTAYAFPHQISPSSRPIPCESDPPKSYFPAARCADPDTQPLEPTLFPKLRIYFADFPWIHSSAYHRLLTLGT